MNAGSGGSGRRGGRGKARAGTARPPQARRKRTHRRLGWLGPLIAGLGVLALPFTLLLAWASLPASGAGEPAIVEVPTELGALEQARLLARRGLVRRRWAAAAYLWLARARPEPGAHVVTVGLSLRQLVLRLERRRSRPVVRITIPEGSHQLQVAQRLEQAAVCPASAFVAAARSAPLLEELGIQSRSAEGYLFPATYELRVNSPANEVVRLLVGETRKRLARLEERHTAGFERARSQYGLEEGDILCLASIVEREASQPDERPLVASVYLNRLTDPAFEPRRRLQADPTAAYGCIVAPELAPSCARYSGRVTPEMLRDAANPYNTYRHEGLPPTPIANPGEASIRAVVEPARTDYLFFVANGRGGHTFSRVFAEHQRAVAGGTAPP